MASPCRNDQPLAPGLPPVLQAPHPGAGGGRLQQVRHLRGRGARLQGVLQHDECQEVSHYLIALLALALYRQELARQTIGNALINLSSYGIEILAEYSFSISYGNIILFFFLFLILKLQMGLYESARIF